MMTEEFFETYYAKMLDYSKYCENQRFLVNNNLFFGNMVITENLPTMESARQFHEAGLAEEWLRAYPAFVFVTNREAYAAYGNNYGKHFHQASLE